VIPQTDTQWAEAITATLPTKWRRRMLAHWGRSHMGEWSPDNHGRRVAANIELRETVAGLCQVRIPLSSTDADLCQRAESLAAACFERGQIHHDMAALHGAMERICRANGYTGPRGLQITQAGAMARMTDPIWHRRQLRKLHAKNVEGAAIRMGMVNRARQCYVSDETLARRMEQNRRNVAMLEGTTATNELGQEYTLAELAAKGTSNKAVRRAELMTRISGFERIAIDLGHGGLFFTVTCPSYMHKWRTVHGGGVVENPRYKGTTPRQAQAYLAKVWSRIRAALHRAKVGIYGFRIAEPNHDGTPHWHLLVFHAAEHLAKLREIVLRYALREAPDEPGAALHRVDFKPIDAGKGTAAGYIAKYVAKNIDGYKLDADLYGNPALETSARVEAWATTWGIRQFQQIGGPPVTVWRELRRVKAVPENAPDHLKQAWRAVNKVAKIEGRDNACVAWDHYTRAQGGVFCGRRYAIRVEKVQGEGLGRYGEPLAPAPIGVSTIETYTPAHMAWMTPPGQAERRIVVESDRHQWTIKVGRGVGFKVRECAPWTRVNNCTVGDEDGHENGPGAGAGGSYEGVEWSAWAYQGDGGGICGPNPGGFDGASGGIHASGGAA
jgi:hypothetical protein